MFNLDEFIAQCKAAVKQDDAQAQIRSLVEKSVSDPTQVLNALGEPKEAGVNKLYVADDLTILNLVWGPKMILMPHNHQMWAVIGIYTGREDNIFWRRIEGADNGALKAASARSLATSDVASLGADVIHSVANPLNRLTGALHVYGGNFFEEPRSEWDPESLEEGRYDVEKNLNLFKESNRFLSN